MKVLLLDGGGLGNVVHSTVAIEGIRQAGHDLTVWCGGEWGGLAQFIDHDQVITGELPDLDSFDRVFRTPFALTGSDVALAEKVGKTAEGSLVPCGPNASEVEACFWFARCVGYDGLMPPPKVRYDDTSVVSGEYVVIAPGVQTASIVWLKKKYPHWREVVLSFLDKFTESKTHNPAQPEAGPGDESRPRPPGCQVVFVGSASDSEPWMSTVGIDLCGQTNLWTASGVVAKALCVAGPDNGLTALAAAIGVPTVVLWGPTDVVKNRKIGPSVTNIRTPLACAPCQYGPGLEGCQHANCMAAINPSLVTVAIEHAVNQCGRV